MEAPSRAIQGAAERPAGRWARRSRATKAHGSQAAGLDEVDVDALGRHEAAVGEGDRPPVPTPVQERPRTRSSTTMPARRHHLHQRPG